MVVAGMELAELIGKLKEVLTSEGKSIPELCRILEEKDQYKLMEAIAELLTRYDCGDVFFADDAQQKAELWKLRRRVAEAVKINGYTIEEDTVVPRAELPALIRGVKALGKQYNFEVVCYGHAGDGNLHIRIRKPGSIYSLNNPDVIPALGRMIIGASKSSQVWVVTHSPKLIAALKKDRSFNLIELEKKLSSTQVKGQTILDRPEWKWPD